jgi:hypothetical protein
MVMRKPCILGSNCTAGKGCLGRGTWEVVLEGRGWGGVLSKSQCRLHGEQCQELGWCCKVSVYMCTCGLCSVSSFLLIYVHLCLLVPVIMPFVSACGRACAYFNLHMCQRSRCLSNLSCVCLLVLGACAAVHTSEGTGGQQVLGPSHHIYW